MTGVFFTCQSQKGQEKAEIEKAYTNITVQQLSQMLQTKDFTLINVHIPYEGEIPQTDLFIPYNEIENNTDKLPQDKNAKLVVYCRSDRMSNIAAQTLSKMGYNNILNLKGGMRAWKEAGHELLKKKEEP